MSNLEFNKIAAAVFLSGIIAIAVSETASFLYREEDNSKRGYEISVANIIDTANIIGTANAAEIPKAPKAIDIKEYIANADIAKGHKLTKICSSCHNFDNGGKNKVGPNLFGVVGANRASHKGYKYSKALTAMKAEKWDTQSLSEFLTKPKKFAKGTKMGFRGFKKPEDRAAVIKYLQSLK